MTISVADGAIDALRVRGEQHMLLLPRSAKGSPPASEAEVSQAVRVGLGEARRALAAAWATLSRALDADMDLGAMGVSAQDLRLLRAALPAGEQAASRDTAASAVAEAAGRAQEAAIAMEDVAEAAVPPLEAAKGTG